MHSLLGRDDLAPGSARTSPI